MEPLVSVIVPVYNVLPYLREALDSVINQTYKNLEILVVDDGSTDGSGAVCDEYLSDPRVIVIHQENRGLSGARNTALDRMTGEYVAFLDSDDAFMPEMIERMVAAVIQSEASTAVCGFIACCTEKCMNTPGIRKTESVRFDEQKKISKENVLNLLIAGRLSWTVWNKLYKVSIWKEIRFPEGSNYEDMRIMCQIIEQCQHVVTVPGIQVLYRIRTSSISHSPTAKNIQDHLIAVSAVEDYIQKHGFTVFRTECIQLFRERCARTLSFLYVYLAISPHSGKTRIQFRNDILRRWELLEGVPCQLQSRITRSLFLHAPVLLIPAQFCWRIGKKLLGRV